jgi:hypothetical protein
MPWLLRIGDRGIAPNVHHTRRFAEIGERYAKILVCGECHELANLMQRMRLCGNDNAALKDEH